jgi:DNA-binding transcriptional MerR regulator
MDVRALSEATGVQAGTLNAWVQRGFVPGMGVETSGRRRDFNVETATHIGIMAEMVKLGFSASFASRIAEQRARHRKLLIGEAIAEVRRRLGRPGGKVALSAGDPEATATLGFHSEEGDLVEKLDHFPGGRPGVYVVVDVDGIKAHMQQAEQQWQQSRNPRDTKTDD